MVVKVTVNHRLCTAEGAALLGFPPMNLFRGWPHLSFQVTSSSFCPDLSGLALRYEAAGAERGRGHGPSKKII